MGENVYIRDLVDFDVTVSTSKEKSKLEYKFQDQENSEDIFSFGSALEDFICVVFVPDRNILDKSRLWHSRLGYVNKKCIAQLQKDGWLESFDFKLDDVCESCLLGKITKSSFTGSCEKVDMDMFILLNISRIPLKYSKVSQLAPPRTPQLNGVDERRNRTLLDMVQSMMSRATLPISLWGYALEIAIHILNLVPTKKVSKTPFEKWKEKRPSLGHIKIRGCKVYVRREAQGKLEARSEKSLFISYPEELFGYLFYKPKDNVVFVAQRGVFLEREMISKEESGKVVTPIKPDDISLPIRRTSGRVSKPPQFYYGFHIEEDKSSDSTLSELDELANYKEAMASPEAAKHDLSLWWEEELRVTGYCDASWKTDKDDSRSQSGRVFLLNKGVVTWKSSKQDIVADSTCESEYIAACEALKEAIWMKNFIRDLRVVPIVQDPIEIFYDNESVVALNKEPKDHEKSKHIERKYHFVRSKVEEGHVIVKHIRSEDNPADPFTKALAKSRHDEHARSIGLKDNIKF
ncbi:retrotransposon protein, putative, ty1-copia subclass [Tanacetum coccineum]